MRTYKWRKHTYKTIAGLQNAARAAFAGCFISLGRFEMHMCLHAGGRVIMVMVFDLHHTSTVTTICDLPKETY